MKSTKRAEKAEKRAAGKRLFIDGISNSYMDLYDGYLLHYRLSVPDRNLQKGKLSDQEREQLSFHGDRPDDGICRDIQPI